MNPRISLLLNAFGTIPATVLLVLAVDRYRSGASVMWVVVGAALFLWSVQALLQDIRRLRRRPTP
jgi:hypothetical protein